MRFNGRRMFCEFCSGQTVKKEGKETTLASRQAVYNRKCGGGGLL